MSGIFFQDISKVDELLALIRANKDPEIEACRRKNGLSPNVMARLFARAGNEQKVSEHLMKHPKTVHQVARGYAEAGNFAKVEEYRTRYNASITEIIKGYKASGFDKEVENYAYSTIFGSRIQNLIIRELEGYIHNQNHEMVELIRDKHHIPLTCIQKMYRSYRVPLPAQFNQLIPEQPYNQVYFQADAKEHGEVYVQGHDQASSEMEAHAYAQSSAPVSKPPQPAFYPAPPPADMIKGGIHTKYIMGKPHSRLPKALPPQNYTVSPYQYLDFAQVNEHHSTLSAYYLLDISTDSFSATLYTDSQNITPDAFNTFICAGRVQNAYIPPGKSILICTQEEVEALRPHISPQINLLVVHKIESQYNGAYTQLGSVTARRLAAFLFAYHFNCPHFTLLDDNIKRLAINPASVRSSSWDKVFDFLSVEAIQQASISVGTLMGRKKAPNELGSKLFWINMAIIREKLKGAEELFLLFPNAAQALKWGEDYYFQIVLHYLFESQGIGGYGIVPIESMGLLRSKKHQNVFAASGKKAEPFHLENQLNLFPPFLQHVLQLSINKLNQIIADNYRVHEALEENIQQADLSLLHAQANNLAGVSAPLLTPSSDLEELELSPTLSPPEEMFKTLWAESLNNYDFHSSMIRDYQAEAIKSAAGYKEPSRLVMATGSGKSLIQSTWALMAHQAALSASVFIVTPHIDLVHQFYVDLLRYNDSLLERNDLLWVLPQNIITVSSHQQSISVDALMQNKLFPQQKLIIIICEDSFKKLLDEASPMVSTASLILLDEYHYYSKTVKQLIETLPDENKPMIIGSSATPPLQDVLKETLYTLSLEQALNGRYHAPIIAESLGIPYSPENADLIINDLPRLLKTHYHPGFHEGATLAETKGIIYLASIELCRKVKQMLLDAGIDAYEIHSKNPQDEEQLKEFVQHSKSGVLLAVRKLRFGFDCPDLGWELILRKPAMGNEKQDIEQMIGRVIRLYQDKIGYVVTFSDIHEKYIQPLIKNQNKIFAFSTDYLAQDIDGDEDKSIVDMDTDTLQGPLNRTVSSTWATLFSANNPNKRKRGDETLLESKEYRRFIEF
ncbi:DEAD/DEAH box helicase [Legionella saoudiensis]|uniref:DEAD/DEAH box helicase n=1 Tax=Legionella saoudiensis TaxID=1750561 RepID=UPI000730AD08|nr:DEAD/DEAH box helicase family protein [Legionella saoudiensis]